jgi:ubiquinone/menaquinone biosynthesis C-methylase UbiE
MEPLNHSAVAAAYDLVASVYDRAHLQKKSLAENASILKLLGRLLAEAPARSRILDLGCGTGFPLDHLRIGIFRYIGVDVSPRMLEEARAKHPNHRFMLGSMEALGGLIPSNSQDLVISLFGSLSYAEPAAVSAEVERVLRPGGRYLLMALSRRYRHRSTYILNGSGNGNGDGIARTFWDRGMARKYFGPDRFEECKLWGMSRLIDQLPEWLPQKAFGAVCELEQRFIGQRWPESSYFLIMSGRKPAQGEDEL